MLSELGEMPSGLLSELSEMLSDIDGCYISEVTTNLRDLFPTPNRISNYLFVIKGRDRFFFEITAQSGDE